MVASKTTTVREGEEDRHEVSSSAAALLVPRRAYPWLLIQTDSPNQILYDVSDSTCFDIKIPALCHKIICASSHGWLVLIDYVSGEFSLYNPLSQEKIRIPSLPRVYSHGHCYISSHPSSRECRIVFVQASCFRFCGLGDEEYRKHYLGKKKFFTSASTLFKGRIFGVVSRMGLVAIDFDSGARPRLERIIRQQPPTSETQPAGIRKSQAFMVECGGQLLWVEKLYTGSYMPMVVGFSIFRADLTQRRWVKITDIGRHHAIFLAIGFGTSLSVTIASNKEDGGYQSSSNRVMGNSIYFLESRDAHMYAFNLENQRMLICSTPSLSPKALGGVWSRHWFMSN